jgi:hypothetical protein
MYDDVVFVALSPVRSVDHEEGVSVSEIALSLGVLTGEVGQAADGWVAADACVGPVVVVGV